MWSAVISIRISCGTDDGDAFLNLDHLLSIEHPAGHFLIHHFQPFQRCWRLMCLFYRWANWGSKKKKKNMAQGYTDGKTQSQDISLTVAPPSPPPARFWCPVDTFQNGQLSGWKVFSESLLSQLGASKKYVCAKRGSVNSRPQSFVTFWGSQQRHRPMEELSRIYLSVICL